MSQGLPSSSPETTPPPVLAVYGRPLNWGVLVVLALSGLLVMTVVTAAVAWWAWRHLAAQVVLREQQAEITLPEKLVVKARVDRRVQVDLNQDIPVRVPVKQTVSLPVRDTLPVQVTVDTLVPISLDVPVKQVIKVDQTVHVDTTVRTRVMGVPVTLPIQGDVPVQADVPVDITIPVRHQLPVALLTTATVQLNEPLRADLDTVVEARIPLKQRLSLPVSAPVDATLAFPGQRVQAGLNLMTLTIPFDSVKILPRPPQAASQAH